MSRSKEKTKLSVMKTWPFLCCFSIFIASTVVSAQTETAKETKFDEESHVDEKPFILQ